MKRILCFIGFHDRAAHYHSFGITDMTWVGERCRRCSKAWIRLPKLTAYKALYIAGELENEARRTFWRFVEKLEGELDS